MDSQDSGNAGSTCEVRRHDTSNTGPIVSDMQPRKDNIDNREAHAEVVPKSATDRSMTELLEELRRVQERLSDIDERTKSSPNEAQPAPFIPHTLNRISEQQIIDSFLTGLKEQDPPSRVISDAQKSTSEFFSDITFGRDLNSLQKYIRFERRKLELKHMDERRFSTLVQDQLLHRYRDLFWTTQKETKDHKLTTEDAIIQPSLNHVDWVSFKACGEDPETASFIIDVLVGEPILPDSLFSTIYTHRRKPTVFQDEQKMAGPKESAVSGQEPLPERIRIHSSVLLTLLSKIHGTEISKKGGAVVMVRPFKALSFYHIQLRDWYEKLRDKFSPLIDRKGSEGSSAQDTMPRTDLEVETSPRQPTNAEVDSSNLGANKTEHSFLGSIKVEEQKDSDASTSQAKDDITMSLTAFTHLRCLLEFADTTIVEKQKYLEDNCKKVSFVDLWHLFKPGMEVLEPSDKYMQCYRVVKVTTPKHKIIPKLFFPLSRNKGKNETTASIHCVYVDFDGRLLGPVSKRFDISRFEGQKDITSLPVYPLSLIKNKTTARQMLIERGERFLKVIQVGHMHYSGLTLESRDEVDSQVVVDFAEALTERREDERNEHWKPNVQLRLGFGQDRPINRRLIQNSSTRIVNRVINESDDSDDDGDDDQGEDCDAECCSGDDVHNDSYVDQKQNEQFLSDMLADTDDESSPASLAVVARVLQQDRATPVTNDDKIIMSYRVFGFILRSRSWGKCLLSPDTIFISL